MRWHHAIAVAGLLASLMAACGERPPDSGTATMAYVAVLRALEDSLGQSPVWVQHNPILVSGFMSAPGDRPEHFSASPSDAIAEAVSSSASHWRLCPALAAACAPRPARLIALSELDPPGADTADVWITFADLASEGSRPSWQILYYRVTLRRVNGGWVAEAPQLLGGEP